jgi:hypothetical protein
MRGPESGLEQERAARDEKKQTDENTQPIPPRVFSGHNIGVEVVVDACSGGTRV